MDSDQRGFKIIPISSPWKELLLSNGGWILPCSEDSGDTVSESADPLLLEESGDTGTLLLDSDDPDSLLSSDGT